MQPESRSARDRNRALVLGDLLARPVRTRGEIVAATGISKPSVSRIVRELMVEGFVQEGAPSEPTGAGRPTRGIELSSDLGCVVGFDLGSFISRAVCLSLSGRVLATWEGRTPLIISAAQVAGWIAGSIDELVAQVDDASGRIGTAVVSVPTRTMGHRLLADVDPGFEPLAGDALITALEAECSFPLRIETDSAAALVTELDRGAAAEFDDVVLITISQTTTAAVAIGRTPVRGRNNAAGSIRLLPFGPDQMPVDDAVSVPGVSRALAAAGLSEDGWSEILGDALGRRPEVAAIRERFIAGVTLIVGALAGSVDPEAVIFDGRMVPILASLLDVVRERLEDVLPAVPELRVVNDSRLYSSATGAGLIAAGEARRALIDQLPGARSRAEPGPAAG